MVRTLALLLPALIPSWRFFAAVGPSPRIEVAWLASIDEMPGDWMEIRPHPAHAPVPVMLARLLWNPYWNETLYLISRTERFLECGSERALRDIVDRIRADLYTVRTMPPSACWFQMRIILVDREGDRIVRAEVYRSPAQTLNSGPSP